MNTATKTEEAAANEWLAERLAQAMTDPTPLGFWEQIEKSLDQIVDFKPANFWQVRAILNQYPANLQLSSTSRGGIGSFFAGSGGDRSLWSALCLAGWRMVWAEAGYYYVAKHSETGDLITYAEGDVYQGDTTKP